MSQSGRNTKRAGTEHRAQKLGVVPILMGLVTLGVLAGASLAWFLVPDLMAASALGGGMIFGAVGVFAYLFAEPAVLADETEKEEGDTA